MKLIDIEDEVLWKNLSEGRRSAKQVVKLFMKQRTVEAIPIEWLLKWNKAQATRGLCNVKEMISDWRKENGAN